MAPQLQCCAPNMITCNLTNQSRSDSGQTRNIPVRRDNLFPSYDLLATYHTRAALDHSINREPGLQVRDHRAYHSCYVLLRLMLNIAV